MNFKISVVIPTKNEEDLISKCIEAVLNQSYKPYEVVVVDGFSKDDTVKNAEKYPIKVIYEHYGSVGGARQEGLNYITGDYVAFTDADCIPDKIWLENLIKELDVEIVGVGGGIINIGDGIWGKSMALIMNTFLGSANSIQGRIYKEKKYVKSLSGCNSIFSKDILKLVGGYDVSLSINEDTKICKKLIKYGKLLYVQNANVVHYQKRGLLDYAKRMYQFGCGRSRLRLWDIQCIPPIVAIFLLLSIFVIPNIFILTLFFYLIVVVSMGIKISIDEDNLKYSISIPLVYLIEHIFYIIGFWNGIF